jgi:hypothetical protein
MATKSGFHPWELGRMEKSGLSVTPLSHFVTRLRTAEVVFEPYPHYYLENVFPTEYYQELLRHLPTSAAYENYLSYATLFKLDHFQYRVQRGINEGWTKNLPAELREFWGSFNEWFLGPELAQAALESFAAPLRSRFGEGTPWPMVSLEAQLFRHRAGYSLGPHSEWRTKIVVLLIYLAPDESALHLGTSLYRPKDRGFSCPESKTYPFDDFVRVKTAPYKPNSLLAFLRSDISFHGVEPLSDQDVTALSGRDLIQYVIYDKKAREEDLLARRLAPEKEAAA